MIININQTYNAPSQYPGSLGHKCFGLSNASKFAAPINCCVFPKPPLANRSTPHRPTILSIILQDISFIKIIRIDRGPDIADRDREGAFPGGALGTGVAPAVGEGGFGAEGGCAAVVGVAGYVVGVEGGVYCVLCLCWLRREKDEREEGLLSKVHVRTCRKVRHQDNPVLGTPFGTTIGSNSMAMRRIAIFHK
jgi:hypothetical protein